MSKRYSQIQVEEIYKEHGFKLEENYKSSHLSLYCIDEDGYKYSINLHDLISGNHPCKFHIKNPYTIHNIKNYLQLNNISLVLLDDQYISSKTNMHCRCECGTVFETTWGSILSKKRYCNQCAKSKGFDDTKDFTGEVEKICCEKNYTLLTNHIKRSEEFFEYICNKHKEKGIQKSTYNRFTNQKSYCRYCGHELSGKASRKSEAIIKKEVESKGFIYVGLYYNDYKCIVRYICPKHQNKGVQTITTTGLSVSSGKCGYCAGYNRSKEDMQDILDNLHGTIEILEYIDYKSSIKTKCKLCGHIWDAYGDRLILGSRCPNCTKSRTEIDVSNILNKWGYQYTKEFRFADCRDVKPLPFDFYLNDFNVLIEVDGEGHYMPVNFKGNKYHNAIKNLHITQKHDKIKTKYCRDNHIQLIRIPYWKREELEYFLWNKFVKFGVLEEIAV